MRLRLFQSQGDPARSPGPPLLAEDVVHVWCAAIDLPASRVRALEGTLTPDELARAGGFRFARDRDRFVASRGILRAILARYLDASPGQLRFRYGPYGKPALANGRGADVRFNLAHAYGLAVYALVAGREVGIDLERVRPHSFDEQVAAQYFSAQENSMLRALPLHRRQEVFLRLWTRKEACAKARGVGLSAFLSPAGASPGGEPVIEKRAGDGRQRRSQWLIKEFAPERGYVAALAVQGGEGCRLIFGRWSL